MRTTGHPRLLLAAGLTALALVVAFLWQRRQQDRHDPLLHGQRLSQWVLELDRDQDSRRALPPATPLFVAKSGLTRWQVEVNHQKARPSGYSYTVNVVDTALAADHLSEVPQLASAKIVAFLKTRNSRTRRIYDWCERNLPKPLFAALPRPWVCRDPRRVVGALSRVLFGPDLALRAELEVLCQDPDGGLHELAYRALLRTGFYRSYHTDLLDTAPVVANGLQHPSLGIQSLALGALGEFARSYPLTQWPDSLPPLAPMLEQIVSRSADMAARFEAEGLLLKLDPDRRSAASTRSSPTNDPPSQTSRLPGLSFALPAGLLPSTPDFSRPPTLYENAKPTGGILLFTSDPVRP